MKHSHLTNYTAVARATTSRVQGAGRRLAWLRGCSGAPAMSYPRRPRNAVVDHVSTSPWPVWSSSFSNCHSSHLPGCAATSFGLAWSSVDCLRQRRHTRVKGDGVAEACAVRTHAACTSTLVALRPPLRGCEPFFKISFLALGSRSTSGSCRGQTTVRRDATVSSSITSRARIDSAAWAINPDHPSLNWK